MKNAFSTACNLEWGNAVNLILTYPGIQKIISEKEMKDAFLLACSVGWLKVIDFFLNHPSSKEFISYTNNEGETGFMKACRSVSICELMKDI